MYIVYIATDPRQFIAIYPNKDAAEYHCDEWNDKRSGGDNGYRVLNYDVDYLIENGDKEHLNAAMLRAIITQAIRNA